MLKLELDFAWNDSHAFFVLLASILIEAQIIDGNLVSSATYVQGVKSEMCEQPVAKINLTANFMKSGK